MDMNAVYVALPVCSAVGLLLIVLSIPLAQGKVKRNGLYGFRTPKTLSDDAIWYPANRVAAINFMYAGIFIMLAAIVLYFCRNSIPAQVTVLIMAGVTIVSIIAALVKSFMFLSNLTPEK